jgi:hypothetical protein
MFGGQRCPDRGGQFSGPKTSAMSWLPTRLEPETWTKGTQITGRGTEIVEMKFEVAVVPVPDADRAKAFYAGLGWRLDPALVGPTGDPGTLRGLR